MTRCSAFPSAERQGLSRTGDSAYPAGMKARSHRLERWASALLLCLGCAGEATTPADSATSLDTGPTPDGGAMAPDAPALDGASTMDGGPDGGAGSPDGGTTSQQSIEIRLGLTPWLAAGSDYVGFVQGSNRLSLPLTFALREAPDGMQLAADGQISWTPRADQTGAHRVIVEVSDGSLVATSSASVVVSAVTPQATALISASTGGALQVTDPNSPLFGVALDVPAGALDADTELSIALLGTAPPAASTGLPVNSAGIELLPSGLSFQLPVRLSAPYDPSDVPPAAPESSVRMFNFLPRAGFPFGAPIWVQVESAVDTQLKVVTSTLTHFSTYFLYASGLPLFDVYQTPHFNIRYTTSTIFGLFSSTLPIDDAIWIEAGGPVATYDPAVPNQVEDLGDYLETAYETYRREGFPVATLTRYEIDLGSAPLSWFTPEFQGMAGGGGLTFDLIMNPTIPNYAGSHTTFNLPTMRLLFSQTVAHEFFHVVQANAIAGTFLPSAWWQSVHQRFWGHAWLQEATAEVKGRQVFSGGLQYVTSDILANRPINEGGDPGYEAWPFLAYLAHAHPTVRLPWRLFNRRAPEITNSAYGWLDSGLDYVNRRLDELMPDEDYLQDFGFRFQSYRKNTHLPEVELWFTRAPTSTMLNDAAGAPLHTTALALAAAPRVGLEPAVWRGSSGHSQRDLRPGTVLSYIVDLERVRDIPDHRSLELILRPESAAPAGELEGVLYETPSTGAPRVLRRGIQPGDEIRTRLVELGTGSKLTLTFARAPDGVEPAEPFTIYAEFEQWSMPLDDAQLYLQIGTVENGRTVQSRIAVLGQDSGGLELLGSLPIDAEVLRQTETVVDPAAHRLFHLITSGVAPTGVGLLHIHVTPPDLPILAPWRGLTGNYVSVAPTLDRNGVVARLTTGDWTTVRPIRLGGLGQFSFGADVRTNSAFDGFGFIPGTTVLLATNDSVAKLFEVEPPNHRITFTHEVPLDCPGSRGGLYMAADGRHGYQLCRMGSDDAKILTYALDDTITLPSGDDVRSIRVIRESLYGAEMATAFATGGRAQVTEDSIVFSGGTARNTMLYSVPRDPLTGDVGDLAELAVDLNEWARVARPETPPGRLVDGYAAGWLATTPDGTLAVWSFARRRTNVPVPTAVLVFSANGSGGWTPEGWVEVGGFAYAFVGAIE